MVRTEEANHGHICKMFGKHETSAYHSLTDRVTHLCYQDSSIFITTTGMCSGFARERFHHLSLQIQLQSILKMVPIKGSIHYALGVRWLYSTSMRSRSELVINIAFEVLLYVLAELNVQLAEWGRFEVKFTITRKAQKYFKSKAKFHSLQYLLKSSNKILLLLSYI